jgi:hypothetical protein
MTSDGEFAMCVVSSNLIRVAPVAA